MDDFELMLLTAYIRKHGPIPTMRVSSAQARGSAKRYSYWGAVRYEVRLGGDGYPTNKALERASSDRRSLRLAEQDAQAICDDEGRIMLGIIGRLMPEDVSYVLDELRDRGLLWFEREPSDEDVARFGEKIEQFAQERMA